MTSQKFDTVVAVAAAIDTETTAMSERVRIVIEHGKQLEGGATEAELDTLLANLQPVVPRLAAVASNPVEPIPPGSLPALRPMPRPDTNTPTGTRPDGTRADGTRPDGTRPDGTRPTGTRADGTTF